MNLPRNTWLKARTEFELASSLRPRKVTEFDTPSDLRSYLITTITGYLREIQPNDWGTAMIVRSFLTEPEAVRLVSNTISHDHPEQWNSLREALLGEAEQISWLSDEQRESLGRAVL